MELKLDDFKFKDAAGKPARLVLGECLKAEPGEPRRAYRVTCNDEPALLKVQQVTDRKRRYLEREAQALAATRRADLPVPCVLATGKRGRAESALVLQWFDGRRPLRDAAPDERGRAVLTDMLGRVRLAGFADKDFGAHNLLVDDALDVVWVDLERAYEASPDDADATMRTCGAALASWWIATKGNPSELAACFADLQHRAPEPQDGWQVILEPINQYMHKKVAALIERGWIDTPAQSLTL